MNLPLKKAEFNLKNKESEGWAESKQHALVFTLDQNMSFILCPHAKVLQTNFCCITSMPY